MMDKAFEPLCAYLRPDETILWAGSPDPQHYTRYMNRRMGKLALTTTLTAVVAMAIFSGWMLHFYVQSGTKASLSDMLLLVGLPSGCMLGATLGFFALFWGLYSVIRGAKADPDLYAVTNQGLLWLERQKLGRPKLRRFSLTHAYNVNVRRYPDGLGTLIFGDTWYYTGSGRNRRRWRLAFVGILDVAHVIAIAQEAARKRES
jgi:hypothetical protein